MVTEQNRFAVRCRAGCCAVLLLAAPGAAQTAFTEVTDEIGVALSFTSRSIAFGDYDNDGLLDVLLGEFINDGDRRLALLHNEGDGRFSDQTQAMDEAMTPESRGKAKGAGAIFGDYDNDGDLDIFVPIGSYVSEERGVNALLRNDRGVFANVTLEAGLTDSLPTDNAIWLDYDRDGDIDLYTGNAQLFADADDPTVRNKLYRNNGDGTFADVTAESGLDVPFHPQWGGSQGGMVAGDFNDDGWPDLYLGVGRAPNRLFLNDGQGGYRDATTAEIGDPGDASGVTAGDVDNDGDLDIFQAAGGTTAVSGQRSLMLLNLGGGQFLDVLEAVGLTALTGNVRTLHPGLADIDNDGDLDLVTAFIRRLFLNRSDGTFVEEKSLLGIPAFGPPSSGAYLAFGDYDEDGFVDLWLERKVARNNGNGNHWLRVEVVGVASNRNAIGARLIATSGDLRQTREVFGGLGWQQDEMIAHFGLGQRTRVDQLEIRWPSGQQDVLRDILADQKIRVFEGREEYHVVRPTVWEQAPPGVLVAGSTTGFSATVRPALFEAGAVITRVAADLSRVGGPANLPLAGIGDGRFRVATTLTVNGLIGWRAVSVAVDQTTPAGPHWTQLSKSILVAPSEDLPVFSDGVEADWQLEPSQGLQLDTSNETHVYQGRTALELRPKSVWRTDFLAATPVNPVGYTHLRFAFHPGDASGGSLSVTLNAPSAATSQLLGVESAFIDLDVADWQVAEVPLAPFRLHDPIESIRFWGTLKGTFYIDDIRLVAARPSVPATTAVVHEGATALPQVFALDQNYPNPFNNSTAIHFSLPQTGGVDLAILNLAGQKVATLVHGRREAGGHTICWDGRDDHDRELASGAYLYRLETAAQTQTRKLLLLR